MASQISNLAKFLWFGGNGSQFPGNTAQNADWRGTVPQWMLGMISQEWYPVEKRALAELRLTKPGFVFNPNTDICADSANRSANLTNYLLPSGNGYPGVIRHPGPPASDSPFCWNTVEPYDVNKPVNAVFRLYGSRISSGGFRITATGGPIGPFSGCLVCVDERDFHTRLDSLVLGWIDFTTPTVSSYTQPEGGQLVISEITLTLS